MALRWYARGPIGFCIARSLGVDLWIKRRLRRDAGMARCGHGDGAAGAYALPEARRPRVCASVGSLVPCRGVWQTPLVARGSGGATLTPHLLFHTYTHTSFGPACACRAISGRSQAPHAPTVVRAHAQDGDSTAGHRCSVRARRLRQNGIGQQTSARCLCSCVCVFSCVHVCMCAREGVWVQCCVARACVVAILAHVLRCPHRCSSAQVYLQFGLEP